jgi:hypothetical protein
MHIEIIMMNLTITPHFLLLAILIALSIIIGCRPNVSNGSQLAVKADAEKTETEQIMPSNDGKKFEKAEGWEIPFLSSSVVKAKRRGNPDSKGKQSAVIAYVDYEPPSEVLTEDPLKEVVGTPNFSYKSLGLLKVTSIREFSVNNRKFCYQVRFQRASVNKETGSRSYGGSLFFYSYYDEDGDGKFESLVIDEVNNSGISAFGLVGHIPKWAQKNGSEK